MVQGYGLSVGLESSANLVINPGFFFKITTVTTIVAGTIFLMWLGEQITQRGIGNGISLIIFSGIVAEIPRALVTTFELGRTGAISTLMIIFIFILLILTIMFIVFMERALRKILIEKKLVNKKYLKLKILGSGEIKKNIEISAHFASKQALSKIEKVGGKISLIKNKK